MLKRCALLVGLFVVLSFPAFADTYDVHFGIQGGSVPLGAPSGPSNALLQYDPLTDSSSSFKAFLSNNDIADLTSLFSYPLFGQVDTSELQTLGCQAGLQTFIGGCATSVHWGFDLQHLADGSTHLTFNLTDGAHNYITIANTYSGALLGFDWEETGVLQTTLDSGDDTGLGAIFNAATATASVPENPSLPLIIAGFICAAPFLRRKHWTHSR